MSRSRSVLGIQRRRDLEGLYQKLATELQSEASVFLDYEGAVWDTRGPTSRTSSRSRELRRLRRHLALAGT